MKKIGGLRCEIFLQSPLGLTRAVNAMARGGRNEEHVEEMRSEVMGEEGVDVETNREEETTDGDQTDESADRENKGDWSHLYGPEYCSVCRQNPL